MTKHAVLIVLLSLVAAPATAQSIIYGGGTVAVDAGNHGSNDLPAFPVGGGFVGWRFQDTWSVEFHADRGFAESPERERIEIYGHSVVQDRAGEGYAVLFVWKRRHPGRVGTAVTMGMSTRWFRRHTVSVTRDDPNDTYPVNREPFPNPGAGWAGGVLIPIALGDGWSLAPEVRGTVGLTENSFYTQLYPGVRLMWGF